jgi:hypothetical protein
MMTSFIMLKPFRLVLISIALLLSLMSSAQAFFWSSREHITIDLKLLQTLRLTTDKKYSLGFRNLDNKSFQAYIKPPSGELKRELVVENLVKDVKSTTVDFNIKTSKYLSQDEVVGSLILVIYLDNGRGNFSNESYSVPVIIRAKQF